MYVLSCIWVSVDIVLYCFGGFIIISNNNDSNGNIEKNTKKIMIIVSNITMTIIKKSPATKTIMVKIKVITMIMTLTTEIINKDDSMLKKDDI